MSFALTNPTTSAVIDGPYRYSLTRTWSAGPRICWIMLNPSTADADQDDPTICRCISFSKRWNYGSLVVVNLFALRVTRPAELRRHPDPVGPRNNSFIFAALTPSDRVVAAWGVGGGLLGRDAIVRERGGDGLWCLGVTKHRHPRHPLYVPSDTELRAFAWSAW